MIKEVGLSLMRSTSGGLKSFQETRLNTEAGFFDLVMALNQIDPGLANEVNKVLETGGRMVRSGTIRAEWMMTLGRNIIQSCMQSFLG